MLTVRLTPFRRALATIAAVLVLGALLAACSSGGSSKTKPTTTTTTTSQHSVTGKATRVTHALTIGKVNIERAGDGGGIKVATRKAVLAVAQRYVDTAILTPLETGKLGRGYAVLFAAGIRPAVTGPDQGILTDMSVGQTTSLKETSTPVELSGLLDAFGTPLYLAADFHLNVQATNSTGALTTSRTVELTFEPIGHGWLITAYRASVRRAMPTRAAPRKPATKPTTKKTPKKTTPTTRKR
jgi:hypothetical protein